MNMSPRAESVLFGKGPKQILPPRDVHVWLTRLSYVNDESLINDYLSCLDENELARMNRFAFKGLRHQYLVTRVLIKWLISRYTNLAIQDVHFEYNEYGRPQLPDGLNRLNLKFNISHQGDYILVGLTKNHDIGADIEKVECKLNLPEIAGRFFARSEIEDLMSMAGHRRLSRFYDYWTLKEAYIKACGKGMWISLADFSFLVADDGIILSYLGKMEGNGNPEEWKFWLIGALKEYRMAIALRVDADNDSRLRLFSAIPFRDESEESSFIAHESARVSDRVGAGAVGSRAHLPRPTSEIRDVTLTRRFSSALDVDLQLHLLVLRGDCLRLAQRGFALPRSPELLASTNVSEHG